ncbi:MAG: hypothetical protein ACKO0M_17590 [Cyanobium sp.]
MDMLRWLLLAGLSLGLVAGVRNGWVELRWDRLLHDAGVPFVPDPDAPPVREEPAGQGART